MRLLTTLYFLLTVGCFASNKTIGIYVQAPVADPECAESLKTVLASKYNVILLSHKTLTLDNLRDIDCLAFPGGLGDSDKFDELLIDKKKIVQQYVNGGKAYLGICMGAYFTSHYYFDILKDADAVRYIKRPNADVSREDETIAKVKWGWETYNMYFFDGCAIVGDHKKFASIATYMNGDTMAAIQGKVGVIGCHPESLKDWYTTQEMIPYWHSGKHNKLLLEFVDQLLK